MSPSRWREVLQSVLLSTTPSAHGGGGGNDPGRSEDRLAITDPLAQAPGSAAQPIVPHRPSRLGPSLQAVHSGNDLASAAERVLGFQKTSRKGKAVSVEPLPGVATDELRAGLAGVMGAPHPGASGGDDGSPDRSNATAEAGGSGSGSGAVIGRVLAEVGAVLDVRRQLAATWEAAPPHRLKCGATLLPDPPCTARCGFLHYIARAGRQTNSETT